MRPVRQLKIITSQLELLEDLKQQLGGLLDYINNVLKIGESWIERKDENQTFLEVNMLLAKETSNCIQKCLEIARENQELFQTSSDLEHGNSTTQSYLAKSSTYNSRGDSEYQSLIGKMNETEKSISSFLVSSKSNEDNCTALYACYHKLNNLTNAHSEKLDTLTEQMASQEKLMGAFLEKQKKMDKEFRSPIDGISIEFSDSRKSNTQSRSGSPVS
ncbi:hypothetical protein Btru_009006 [Bulinus truncatus]|nr:hypothetical protein Btru_009006 [Bulinus truncatus]